MTVTTKFACLSCGLPGRPKSALGVCRACVPCRLKGIPTVLAGERLPTPPVESRNAAVAGSATPAFQTGAPSDPEPAAPLAVDGCEQHPWVMDQLVSQLLEWVSDLELQIEDFREQLGEAGYLELVDNDSDALHVALADAEETRRARDVLAANEELFEDEDDVALMLEQAAAVMAEHERMRGQLDEHEWIDGDRSLPEVIDNVLACTAEAERAYGLLLDHDLLPPGVNLPGAVRALIAETVQVRAELAEVGYACWTQAPAEVVRELIADAEEADALEQRCLRERRRSERLADIARRALASAHAAAHGGTIDACPHCAADWVQITASDQIAI